MVLDQESTNGTFMNGALIKQARLSDGDVVQVGSTRIRIQVRSVDDDEPVPRSTQPPVESDDDEVDTLTFGLSGQSRVLQRLSERLASSDGAASAAELVLDAIFEIFPIDRAYLITRRKDRRGILPEVLASRTRDTKRNATGDLDVVVPKLVLSTLCNDPNLVNASEATSALRVVLSERFPGPAMCTPLRQGGETFGTLYLDALTLPVWAQSQGMMDFLSSVGAMAALAVTRAWFQAELGVEQRLKQQQRGKFSKLEKVSKGQKRSTAKGASTKEKTSKNEVLRKQQQINVVVAQDLLQRITAQVCTLNENLSLLGHEVTSGTEASSAVGEATACVREIMTNVEDAVALAELEAGMMILAVRAVDVRELIDDALEGLVVEAEERGVSLHLGTVDKGLKAMIDRCLFSRVLDRLVIDALEHTDRGGRIVISGSLKAATVELVVADSGLSVKKADRLAIFSGETVVDERSFSRGGAGLYFCRLVAEAHGGSVRATGPSGNNRIILSIPAHGDKS